MSEKQFRLSKYVTPTSISYFYNQQGQMLNKEVASMLNKLYDENVQLKEENEQLKKQVKKLKIENEALQDSNDALAEDMFHRLEEVI